MRINLGAKACLADSNRWEWISTWLPPLGEQWAARVSCFAEKKNRLDCTLVLCRQPGYAEAWVIVTDLAPEGVHGAWYRLRVWIEGGFKDYKRVQWGWHHTKMLETERAERLWLALAVSTLWVVGVGAQAEVSRRSPKREQLPATHIACRTAGSGTKGPHGRELSCVTRGRLVILAAAWHGENWPPASFWPEPWPEQFAAARLLPASQEHRRQKERERQRVKRRKHRAARRKSKRMEKRSA